MAHSCLAAKSQRRVHAVEARQRVVAEQAAAAERQTDTLSLFARNLVRAADSDANAGCGFTARELLERGREEARWSLAKQPEVLAHQLEALGLAYHLRGERSLFACRARDRLEALRNGGPARKAR